jgi:hypothetical protein
MKELWDNLAHSNILILFASTWLFAAIFNKLCQWSYRECGPVVKWVVLGLCLIDLILIFLTMLLMINNFYYTYDIPQPLIGLKKIWNNGWTIVILILIAVFVGKIAIPKKQ